MMWCETEEITFACREQTNDKVLHYELTEQNGWGWGVDKIID